MVLDRAGRSLSIPIVQFYHPSASPPRKQTGIPKLLQNLHLFRQGRSVSSRGNETVAATIIRGQIVVPWRKPGLRHANHHRDVYPCDIPSVDGHIRDGFIRIAVRDGGNLADPGRVDHHVLAMDTLAFHPQVTEYGRVMDRLTGHAIRDATRNDTRPGAL